MKALDAGFVIIIMNEPFTLTLNTLFCCACTSILSRWLPYEMENSRAVFIPLNQETGCVFSILTDKLAMHLPQNIVCTQTVTIQNGEFEGSFHTSCTFVKVKTEPRNWMRVLDTYR